MSIERTVHIVDDDADVRRSLARLLQSAGFATCSYDTPLAVLDAASQPLAGCMLVDVRMPELDGLELQLRLKELGVKLPVIMMTGEGDIQTAVRAIKAGAVDFIEKPFDGERLLAAIEGALADAWHTDRGRESIEASRRIAMLSRRERGALRPCER